MNAIEKTKGPCVVLAGAGTGKTYTIVEKIKHLIQSGTCAPEKIVCITFSNEAANNLLMRVRRVLNLTQEPLIRTFHGFAADLLREHGSTMGIDTNFQILTPDEAKVLLHHSLHTPPMNCHRYISTISLAKDLGVTLADLKAYSERKSNGRDLQALEKAFEQLQLSLQTQYLSQDKQQKSKLLKEVKELKSLLDIQRFLRTWDAYEKIKQKQHYQDYADLQVNALELLRKSPEISAAFEYVIVDEFQDTNKVQIEFLKEIAPHRNILVVGDTNQSIYRFRGAYRENLSLFRKYFAVAAEDITTLESSFRSPNTVLKAAHDLILQNYENKEECFQVKNAHGRAGGKLEVYELVNGHEEARKVVELVQREKEEGKSYEDICVMVRTHQQGILIKRALEQADIPYTAVSKNSLLKHPAIKTTIDYLTVLVALSKKQKGAEQAWWDLMYQLDFVEEDLMNIGKFIKEHTSSECLSQELFEKLPQLPLSSSGRLAAKLLIGRLQALLSELSRPIGEVLSVLYVRTGIMPQVMNSEGKELLLNLNKFLELAGDHTALYGPSVDQFLRYLVTLSDLNIEIEAASREREGVRMMTLHATKGLEYKTIIVTNLAQKRFPLERYTANPLLPSELLPELTHLHHLSAEEREEQVSAYERHHQLLEERRLCYVAWTRAREKLIMTYALEYGGKKAFPSQFLQEIQYLKNPDVQFIKDEQQTAQEPVSLAQSAPRFGALMSAQNFEELLIAALKTSDRLPLKMTPEIRTFSPSALLAFSECEKQYEYKYVYHMPERRTFSWESMRLGSFVHAVLEQGVQSRYQTLKEFIDAAHELHLSEEWSSVNLEEVLPLITVFFERNKHKYNEKSRTEQELRLNIEGFQFLGFADRIDYHDDGLEIIDYKTGKTAIAPKHRNWQLGFYALAAQQLGKVKTITLDMLKQEKPLEFALDDQGNAVGVHSNLAFNMYEVEQELLDTAKAIVRACEKGFKPCSPEKNCEFCNEYVYGNY